MFKKNISDCVGIRNESIDTPLYHPLFWLDNIFKLINNRDTIYGSDVSNSVDIGNRSDTSNNNNAGYISDDSRARMPAT